MVSPRAGIVVIGRNEGARLIACLNSVTCLHLPTVYVDSGSTDGSVQAARDLGVTCVELDRALPFTAARARNAGFNEIMKVCSELDLVQFLDGDCTMIQSWMAQAAHFLSSAPHVAVVCGRRRERFPQGTPYNLLMDMEWDTRPGEAEACGGDALVRVNAFQQARGFRSDLMAGEEPEFCARLRKIGWKIWRLDADMSVHDAAIFRFSQMWRRAVRGGYAEIEVALLHLRDGLGTSEKRRVCSTVLWSFLVPFGTLLATLVYSPLILIILVFALQIVRIAIKRGVWNRTSWFYASVIMVLKFAQLYGLLIFAREALMGKKTTIEYKGIQ
jgi:GT2 family glycosyltransferase